MVNGSGDWVSGFSPLVNEASKVLVLGTVPSQDSLKKQQYYGHERNAFWLIMSSLFAAPELTTYQQKVALLLTEGVAVWDVLQSCQREGSLDSSIKSQSITVNDFGCFFKTYPLVRAVFFNGRAAEQIFQRRVLPQIVNDLDYYRLPSTSPAYAAMSVVEKKRQWQQILTML
ncbi:MAG TPA: DNA-deoxyinosine glycosylase [Methylococcaceae bacterium]|nr:DNA-deoxyinosine glycosylase [Methylococcaceae bacterium]HIN67826.1 DNA-deoxyinosine glycosylase [Methylococcales bacterium]HIA45516.1 DNA-deoxyinosine glycosylase [Methylococcaceae bacterium]HIB62898.1 DNA-deoxyinosine glycosylase [Methylococcaceae bacterium]HIO12089.1 DNA-deoxyinosine glycosylase [Methylococcales bacterium]